MATLQFSSATLLSPIVFPSCAWLIRYISEGAPFFQLFLLHVCITSHGFSGRPTAAIIKSNVVGKGLFDHIFSKQKRASLQTEVAGKRCINVSRGTVHFRKSEISHTRGAISPPRSFRCELPTLVVIGHLCLTSLTYNGTTLGLWCWKLNEKKKEEEKKHLKNSFQESRPRYLG